MMTYVILLLIIIVIAGLGWQLRRHSSAPKHNSKHAQQPVAETGSSTRARELEKLKNNKYFWGVEIIHAGCESSRALSGQQFMLKDAPVLPVEGCDKSLCNCIYKGLKEVRREGRRTQSDRREDLRFDSDKPDRRSPKDRRRGEAWNNRDY
ncbi:MAG: hypothetical protein WBN51_06495 [Gammaproteobacteria bacterium]